MVLIALITLVSLLYPIPGFFTHSWVDNSYICIGTDFVPGSGVDIFVLCGLFIKFAGGTPSSGCDLCSSSVFDDHLYLPVTIFSC